MAQMIHVIHLVKDATANEKLVKRFSPKEVGMMQQREPQTRPQPRQLQLRRSQLTRPQPRHFHLVKDATANEKFLKRFSPEVSWAGILQQRKPHTRQQPRQL